MKLLKSLLILSTLLVAYSQAAALTSKSDDETKLAAARAVMDPKKVVTIGDRVYYINSIIKVSDGLAAVLCNYLGMVLTSFETLDEYYLVRDYIAANETVSHFYITSGNRFSDLWIWSGTGQLINEFDWANGYPLSNSTTDATIVINTLSGWKDLYAAIEWYFICEQP